MPASDSIFSSCSENEKFGYWSNPAGRSAVGQSGHFAKGPSAGYRQYQGQIQHLGVAARTRSTGSEGRRSCPAANHGQNKWSKQRNCSAITLELLCEFL